jgi:hypothetical protein
VGFLFEVAADMSKDNFMSDATNRGRVSQPIHPVQANRIESTYVHAHIAAWRSSTYA